MATKQAKTTVLGTKGAKPGGPGSGLYKTNNNNGASTSNEPDEFSIPEIEVKTVEIQVRGLSSLIVHAWGEKAKRQMREKQMKAARSAKEAKDPKADFEASRYIDQNGRDCVPAAAFRNACISAGRFTEGLLMTKIRGAFFILDDMVPIVHKECRMREDMVRVGGKGPGTGVADLRYRAEYIDWSAKLRVQYNANVISLAQITNLFHIAGFHIGICEWRPEKNGQFGRFEVAGQVRISA